MEIICPACNGKGMYLGHKCCACDGKGIYYISKELIVTMYHNGDLKGKIA